MSHRCSTRRRFCPAVPAQGLDATIWARRSATEILQRKILSEQFRPDPQGQRHDFRLVMVARNQATQLPIHHDRNRQGCPHAHVPQILAMDRGTRCAIGRTTCRPAPPLVPVAASGRPAHRPHRFNHPDGVQQVQPPGLIRNIRRREMLPHENCSGRSVWLLQRRARHRYAKTYRP